jgi:hypothetical protein
MGEYGLIRRLERHGVSETQLRAALGEVDPAEVVEFFEGEVPLRRALAERARAERQSIRRRYALLVLAATSAPELARRVGAEGYLRRRRAVVEGQVRRNARRGVRDDELRAAVAAVGRRPIGEALAGPTPFGGWARAGARAARRRSERVAYARLAAARPREVREAIRLESPGAGGS